MSRFNQEVGKQTKDVVTTKEPKEKEENLHQEIQGNSQPKKSSGKVKDVKKSSGSGKGRGRKSSGSGSGRGRGSKNKT